MQSAYSIEDIERIAKESNRIIKSIFDRTIPHESKLLVMDQYEKTMNGILNSQLSDSTNQLQIALGVALFTGMMAMIYAGPSGLDLLKTGLTG